MARYIHKEITTVVDASDVHLCARWFFLIFGVAGVIPCRYGRLVTWGAYGGCLDVVGWCFVGALVLLVAHVYRGKGGTHENKSY